MINNSTMNDPHMIILKNYVEKLRNTNPKSYTPNFDPNDGGINAKILFLFEKPGRKTDPSYGGSGYISLDNKDETARATKKFLKEANINRKKIVIWNTIPSWNGTRDISIEERKQASLQLSSLLKILKNLEYIFQQIMTRITGEHINHRCHNYDVDGLRNKRRVHFVCECGETEGYRVKMPKAGLRYTARCCGKRVTFTKIEIQEEEVSVASNAKTSNDGFISLF